jgi:ABC-2 type transport system permease protein
VISKWAKDVYSIELRKLLSYRADFWMEFVGGMGVHIIASYFLWKAVFAASGATSLGGYSFNHMMVYYLLVPLVEKLVRGHERGSISQEIYDGGLTRYLIYPLSLLEYKYMANLAVSTLGLIQFFLTIGIVLIFFKMPDTVHLSIVHTAMALVAMLLASLLFFLMTACLECVAFWADSVWSLIVMLRFSIGMFGGSMIPVTLFSTDTQAILKWLPFSYIASFPIRTFTGEIPLDQWALGLVVLIFWIGVFYGLTKLVLRRGLYQYSGVGI